MFSIILQRKGQLEIKMSETIEENGACRCRSVKFKVVGKILMNALCHCKACSQNRGMSPVHLIAVTPPEAVQITEGKEFLRKFKRKEECGISFAPSVES